MGMGYGANFAYTISIENMRKFFPNEMAKLEKEIEEEDKDLDYFFRYVDEFEDAPVMLALKKLQKAFEDFTRVGDECLTPYPAFHDSVEEGDRYDDVDGAFFDIDGAEKLTEPAKKFADYLEKSFWVTFG